MNKRQHKQNKRRTHQRVTEGMFERVELPYTGLAETLLPLEPRFMFDAAGLATGAEVTVDATAQAQADAVLDAGQLDDATAPAVSQNDNDDLIAALATVEPPTNNHEIIFVDSSVEDYETLLSGIDPNIEVVMLDADRDGVEQIAEILSGRNDISAIHIISHGDAGQLRLGNTILTAESMQGEHADELAIIKQALSSEADILIYGCNFAEGIFGEQAAEALAELTGADIAASDDTTGATELGGDWDLEYEVGDIQHNNIIGDLAEADWDNVLLEVVNTSGAQTGSYTATSSGQVNITITGADGGNGSNTSGGQGATVNAAFDVNAGDVIEYVAADAGATHNGTSAGGGGGTGVFINDVLVMVAGGGGGGDNSASPAADGQGGTATTAGSSGTGTQAGAGGTLGAGGGGNPGDSAGGGGINSAGGNGSATGGAQADTNAADGVSIVAGGAGTGTGSIGGSGFAGGGGADSFFSGGGGGYSGGGAAGANGGAGGGGSFVDASATSSNITAGGDGTGTEADGSIIIDFEVPPEINNLDTDTLGYVIGSGAQTIDVGIAATVTDTTSADFNSGQLAVDTPLNFPAAANEILTIDGTTGNGITVAGGNVSFNGNLIGTFAGGTAGAALVVSFTTIDATPVAANALLQTINYENTGTTIGASSATFQITDGDGGISNLATVTINLSNQTAANDDATSTNEDMIVTVPASGVLTNDVLPQTNTTYLLHYDAATEGLGPNDGTWQAETGVHDITLDAGATVVTVSSAAYPGLTQAISFTGGGTGATGGTLASLNGSNGIDGSANVTLDFWIKLDDTVDKDVIFEVVDNIVGLSFVTHDADNDGNFDDLSFVISDTFYGNDTGVVTADLSTVLGGLGNVTTDFIHVVGTFGQNGVNDTMELFINGTSVGTNTGLNIGRWDDAFTTAGLGRVGTDGLLSATVPAGFGTGWTDFEGDFATFSVYQSDFTNVNVDQNFAAKGTLTTIGISNAGASASGVGTPFALTSGAQVTINTDGSYTYDPNGAFSTLNFGDAPVVDSFDYTISDVAGGTDTATVFITVESNNEFNLSSLATGGGAQGTIFNGIAAGDGSGYQVVSAGDVNGDGFDDVMIGGVAADPNGTYSGQTYVVFGQSGSFGAEFELSTLNGTNGFVLNGINEADFSGRSVAAGDVNGDGFSDLIIGAVSADPNGSASGESYVVFGRSDFTPILTAGVFELSSLAGGGGTNGLVLNGINANDISGRTVAYAGDVNGDGLGDIAITASGAVPNGANSGETYLVYGRTDFTPILGVNVGVDDGVFELSTLAGGGGTNGTVFNGAINDYSGSSVAGAGDIDGDGFDDLVIGAWGASPGGRTYAGVSYVVFGQSGSFGGTLDLSTLNGTNGFVLNGVSANDYSGGSVSSAGDINGDGFADVVVSAAYADPNGNSNSGTTYVLYGTNGGFAASIDLSSLNASTGVIINGAVTNHFSGFSATSAGDINGDGFDDLIIGRGTYGGIDAGASYVVFGSASLAASIDLSTVIPSGGATVTSGFVLSGITADDYTGLSVSSAGDINGDGFDDLIIGAYYGDPNGTSSGESYIVYGKDFRNEGVIVGSSGADALAGGVGNDAISSGAGDDTIIFDAADTRRIDGGGGVDTLSVTGAAVILDLTTISNTVYQGIEVIDLTGGGNTLQLGALDLFDLSGSTNILTVNGTAADSVTLSSFGSWTFNGLSGGYNEYQLGEAIIRVQNGIIVSSIDTVEDEAPLKVEELPPEILHMEQELIADEVETDGPHFSNMQDEINADSVPQVDNILVATTNTRSDSSISGITPFSQQLKAVANTFNTQASELMAALTS